MSVLPERATRAFPLLLLALLAGLALMLDRMTSLPYFSPNAAQREPDLVIDHFVSTEYAADGTPHYKLNAAQMRHYPDKHAELIRAWLHRTEPNTAPTTVTAESAQLSKDRNEIWFDRNVVMQSEALGSTPALTIHTSQLQLDKDDGTAHSAAPTVAESNGSVLHTTGFDYDHRQAQLKLRANVSIDYAPPKH